MKWFPRCAFDWKLAAALASLQSKRVQVGRPNQTAGSIFKVDLRLEISEKTWQLREVATGKEDNSDLYEVAGSASFLTFWSAENASDIFTLLPKVKKFFWNLKRLRLVWRHFWDFSPTPLCRCFAQGHGDSLRGQRFFSFFPFTPLAPVCLWSSWNLRLIDI